MSTSHASRVLGLSRDTLVGSTPTTSTKVTTMREYCKSLPHNIEVMDDESKVRKIGRASMRDTLLFMQELCEFLINTPDPTIVPVHEFEDRGWQTDGNYKYSYVMERLYPLTRYEKKIIRAIADGFFERGLYPSENYSEIVADARVHYPELTGFMENVTQLGRYTDINEGNFMVDLDGNYRIIDIEGFYHTPIGHNKNRWFQ